MLGSSTKVGREMVKGLPSSRARASRERNRPLVAVSNAPMDWMVGATAATSSRVSPTRGSRSRS